MSRRFLHPTALTLEHTIWLLKKSFVFSLSLIIEQDIDFESTEIPAEAEASQLNVTYYHILSLSISPSHWIRLR